MSQIMGYIGEKSGRAVDKLMVLRMVDRSGRFRYHEKAEDDNKITKVDDVVDGYPLVVRQKYFSCKSDFVKYDKGRTVVTKDLRVLYQRGQVRVYFIDWYTGDSLGFGDLVRSGMLPTEIAELCEHADFEAWSKGLNNLFSQVGIIMLCLGAVVGAFVMSVAWPYVFGGGLR